MNDVADRAGVSRTAVSLVLNDRDNRIAPETRDRIRQIARELGFRPSRAALQLRTRKSRILVLIGDEIASGPFAGGLIAGAQAAASEADHALMVLNTGIAGDVSTVNTEMLEDRQPEGMVLATVMTRRVTSSDLGGDAPTVLLNCFTDDGRFSEILPDDFEGGRTAAVMAIGAGHRRIALVTGESGTSPAEQRFAGYQRALLEHVIDYDPALVRFGDWTAESGYQLVTALLKLATPPTVILCGNDRMALGAYDAVREKGMTIPGDISVIGYDDQREIAAFMHPPLTTIRLPYEEMGRLAVERLFDRREPSRELVRCYPVVRSSVASPRE